MHSIALTKSKPVNAPTIKKTPLIGGGHSRPVPTIAFSGVRAGTAAHGSVVPDVRAISSCLDGQPMLRCGVTADWLGTFLGHKGATWSAVLDESAAWAATASADYTARVWCANQGDELVSFEHKSIVKSVAFPSGKTRPDQLLTAGHFPGLCLFDVARGAPADGLAEPAVRLPGHQGHVKTASYAPADRSNRTIVSAGADKCVKVWDVRTGGEARSSIAVAGEVRDVSFTRDGSKCIVSAASRVTVLDATADFAELYSLPTHDEVATAALNLDEDLLVVGYRHSLEVRLFNASTTTELGAVFGHHGPVHCLRFSPDQQLFASSSEDGTVRYWQTTEPSNYGLWWHVADGAAVSVTPAQPHHQPHPHSSNAVDSSALRDTAQEDEDVDDVDDEEEEDVDGDGDFDDDEEPIPF